MNFGKPTWKSSSNLTGAVAIVSSSSFRGWLGPNHLAVFITVWFMSTAVIFGVLVHSRHACKCVHAPDFLRAKLFERFNVFSGIRKTCRR